jgi:hypothetical protein
MFGSYNDSDDDGSFYEKKKSYHKKSKRLKKNPRGLYNVNFIFKGIQWDITIDNIAYDEFKITAKSNVKVDQGEVDVLKRYLQDEGFEEAATKHNLEW